MAGRRAVPSPQHAPGPGPLQGLPLPPQGLFFAQQLRKRLQVTGGLQPPEALWLGSVDLDQPPPPPAPPRNWEVKPSGGRMAQPSSLKGRAAACWRWGRFQGPSGHAAGRLTLLPHHLGGAGGLPHARKVRLTFKVQRQRSKPQPGFDSQPRNYSPPPPPNKLK